ncbi:MAG: LamG-like jellyroll fold domain-containing protein [Planctomycetota bacterium]
MKNTWITHIWRTLAATALATLLLATPAHADAPLLGDMNGDGQVNAYDIDGFILCVSAGGCGHAGPVGWYPFDGNARDYGGNRRGGIEQNGVGYASGVFGQAATLDGADDWIQVRPHIAVSPEQFTWAAWFQMDTPPSGNGMALMAQASAGFGTGSKLLGPIDDGGVAKLRFQWTPDDAGGNTITGMTELQPGCWYHAVVLYDGTAAYLYLDGELEGSLTTSLPLVEVDLGIGWHADTTGWNCFDGSVDEVRLYDRALGNSEILALARLIVAWGCNDYGLCDAPGGYFSKVSAGNFHSVALHGDGTARAWGLNDYGQCTFPNGMTFLAVDAGVHHSVGLLTDGTLEVWGVYAWPGAPPPSGTFSAIDAGTNHDLGLTTEGELVAWGDNNAYGHQNVPPPLDDYIDFAAGTYHSLGIRGDGTVVAWGTDHWDVGLLDTPPGTYQAVATAFGHNVGLRSDGTLYAWGDNSRGQLEGVPSGTFVAIAVGQYHSLAMRADGTITAWGDNECGQCDVPPGTYTAIAAGDCHSLAIRRD